MRSERVKIAVGVIAASSICWVGLGQQKQEEKPTQPRFVTKRPLIPCGGSRHLSASASPTEADESGYRFVFV
jgi:hypothetical protein